MVPDKREAQWPLRASIIILAASAAVLVGCSDNTVPVDSAGATVTDTGSLSGGVGPTVTASDTPTVQPTSSTASAPYKVPGVEREKVDVDASELLRATIASVKSAQSVQVSFIRINHDLDSDSMFDIEVQRTFANSPDYFSQKKHRILGDIEVMKVGSVTYLKGGAGYWIATGQAERSDASKLREKWVTSEYMPQTGDVFDVFSIFEKPGMSHSVLSAKYSEVWQEERDGVTIYSLCDPNDPAGGKISVQPDGGHELIYIGGGVEDFPVLEELEGAPSMTFTHWNAVEPLLAPPAREVVNLS